MLKAHQGMIIRGLVMNCAQTRNKIAFYNFTMNSDPQLDLWGGFYIRQRCNIFVSLITVENELKVENSSLRLLSLLLTPILLCWKNLAPCFNMITAWPNHVRMFNSFIYYFHLLFCGESNQIRFHSLQFLEILNQKIIDIH